MHIRRQLRNCFAVSVLLFLSSCGTTPLSDLNNICTIFKERPRWYKQAKKSAEQWRAPIHVPMAIIYQESRFNPKARPPMKYFLGVIPKGRDSDAYGYAQALKSTWRDYKKQSNRFSPDRDDFADAYDFVQWYMQKSVTVNKVSKWDAYAQYLNYHEGHYGYQQGSYLKKSWLINVAKKVDKRARNYSRQLGECQARLGKRGWF